ncbi:MAG: ribosome biogenesis GTPase Der [Chitinophagales bacterium]
METVAIVGRPNVGKSTLFNRLTGERKSIVDDQSGVTRDRLYGVVNWNGVNFNIIDTGGYTPESDDVFETAIREQVEIAIEEASVIMFVVDVTTGITRMEDAVTDILRKTNKKVVVVVNKVDNSQRAMDATEFYSLGFELLFNVSSINGSGTGELLDEIVRDMDNDEELFEEDIPRITVLGQPNAGKSSLVNTFLGQERNVVTNIAGTTRDSIDTRFTKFGKDVIIIDTAGLRKKAKVHENLEFYSVIRAVRTLETTDVAIVMIDATKGVTSQDITIFSLAARKQVGIVLVVNKWDLVEKDTNTAREYEANLRKRMEPFTDVPIIFTSVHEKQRILKVLDIAIEVYERRKLKITTSKLNEFLQATLQKYPPPFVKGKKVSIKYITQLHTRTPSFVLFCNNPKYIRPSYKNYIENRFRETWDFTGVPLNIFYRAK